MSVHPTDLWTSTMKLVGTLLLTVAATLVVSAEGQDIPMMQNAMKLVLQMCRDVVKSTFTEEVGEMCKKENAHNITTDCFPEMNGKKISCVLNCLGDSAPEGDSSGGSQDEENETLNSIKFVEALMTKKRKMCIMSIMKDCVQEKTGVMLPA
ncbi:uncharacterized protein [Panulirus ornatus]|uniref:uncharacterized protein n=1 Tax=Panulirus ornatus TaxID=150431 RepID=UPI003A869128